MSKIQKAWLICLLFCCSWQVCQEALAQQFNTDNYLSMPHGTGTFVLTTGQRNAGMASSFGLIPRWEFFAQAFLFWEMEKELVPQHFNLQVYTKYMFWVNEKNTAGGAVFLGFGKSPGYWQQTEFVETHRNIWTALPITIPFLNNAISLDLMPGALYDWNNKQAGEPAWGFTYSSRVAVYKVIPKTAIVAEVYGTEGAAYSRPEYKVGLRWEPNNTVIPAITYGGTFDGSKGSGLEIGVVIISPQFLKNPLP